MQAQGLPYDGIEATVLTFTGPQIAEPMQRRAPEFQKLTGAKITIVTVPNADLYNTILKDQSTGTNSYQGFVLYPQWTADFVNYLEPLDSYIAADKDIQWDDIMPFWRETTSKYAGKTVLIPLDGDFLMVYYRTDVFAKNNLKPPTTWDEYLADAKALNGQDMAGDGKPSYGSCISKKRNAQSYWWLWAIAAPYLQTQGTKQGAFFDKTTMKPLTVNDGFVRALEIMKETGQYGPPTENTMDVGDTRSLFTSGHCALSLDWGDIGPLAIAPGSNVVDKTGAVISPGTKQVVDFKTGKLVDCDQTTCPYAVDGVSAAADPKVKQAVYSFFAYLSAPPQSDVDVTLGKTGFNPYRKSQFTDLKFWEDAGMSETAAKDYLGAIQDSLNNPNFVLDITIPHNQEYQQVQLDTIQSEFLAGQIDAKTAAQNVYDAWETLTEKYGRDTQLKAYLAALGG
jgi:multiple sugar transport system substrate-binding protein